jgi:hypothetical protein
MSRTIQEIESEILQLDPHDRATGEARYAGFRAGETSAVDGDEVFAKARARNR